MPYEVCPRCKKPQPNVGPWKEAGCEFTRLCGPCKAWLTLSDDGRRRRLASDVKRTGQAVGVPIGSVVFTGLRDPREDQS